MTDRVRNALIAKGWENRPEWDTDDDLATPPADLPTDTATGQVPVLAWAAELPAGYAGWSDYLGLDHRLLDLVGHCHMHNEAAWRQRMTAALVFLFPGPGSASFGYGRWTASPDLPSPFLPRKRYRVKSRGIFESETAPL